MSGCDGVSSCSFLSDNALFLTAFDGLLELWDLQQGCRYGVPSPCVGVRAFPDCRKPPAAGETGGRPGGSRNLTLSPRDRVLQTSAHQYQITGCCLSPDRRLLATVCLGGCLKVMTKAL